MPATRDEATVHAWVRHHAATALAAFTAFHRAGFGRPEPGSRPDLGYLVGLGVAATHAAIALVAPGVALPAMLWDLTPEAGALNGEWAAEREGIRLLAGVGGDTEWWIWTPASIGHLRVALTPAEYALVPPGCVIADAGESGPARPRTRA